MVAAGARREAIRVAIGPAIQQASYEVGDDFRAERISRDGVDPGLFTQPEGGGRPHFDLPGYVAARVAREGVASVATLAHCTCREPERFFSYRRATLAGEGDYGRQISAIVVA
jgi:hypothetical protein